jgi:Fur family transcriptional regulator, ferric uptake regulator
MTPSAPVQTTHQSERRSLVEEITGRGIRMTAQRRILAGIIQASTDHLDAAALLERARLQDPGIDRATVYRTLKILKQLRLIDELDLMHLHGEKHYYEVSTREEHMHLACFQCGKVEEYVDSALAELKAEMARRTGFQIRVARLEVGGRCAACQTLPAREELTQ